MWRLQLNSKPAKSAKLVLPEPSEQVCLINKRNNKTTWNLTHIPSHLEIASDGLKGRVFEVSLGDLNENEESFRKFKLIVEEVQGKTCLTNFHGMDITTDKLRSMIKKKQSTIEAFADVKTTDGYTLRVFSIAFTKNQRDSRRDTAYAQAEKVTKIFHWRLGQGTLSTGIGGSINGLAVFYSVEWKRGKLSVFRIQWEKLVGDFLTLHWKQQTLGNKVYLNKNKLSWWKTIDGRSEYYLMYVV